MALKLTKEHKKLLSLEGIEEKYHNLWEPDPEGGGFNLTIDIPDVEDVSGLKSTLFKVREEKKGLEEKFSGVDMDKYNKYLADREEFDRKRELQGKSEEEKIALITERMQKNSSATIEGLNSQLRTEREAVNKATGSYQKYRKRTDLREAAREARVLKEFWDDFDLRTAEFTLVDDLVVPLEADGETIKRSIKNPSNHMPLSEWIEEEGKKRPRWFEGSGGGGSGGGAGGKSSMVVDKSDNKAFVDNLADIAAGKKIVR